MILQRDQAFKVVCSIRIPVESDIIVGTGMFVSNTKNKVWIITASHVAKKTNQKTEIAFGDANSNCTVVPLNAFNSQLNWVYHPIADLAILEVTVNSENASYLHDRCLSYDHLDLTRANISRDVELTVIGFPKGLGIRGRFSPLTFRSYASSSFLTYPRADTHTPSDFFCLENPGVGGYSGGPVFDLGYMVVGNMTCTKEKAICHGIIHGTISDNTGGKIALVTPSYYLADLLLIP